MAKKLTQNTIKRSTLVINGQTMILEPSRTLQDLLETLEVSLSQIAVERNMEIVPRAEYQSTILCPGDELEIVTLMGGG